MKKILIISPIHDLPTSLSFTATRKLKNWISEQNLAIKVVDLSGINANRLMLWQHRDADAIFYYGHGLDDRLGDAFMYVVPILDKNNIHWFRNKIIYTMACFSYKELAPEAIKRGVKAYFGHEIQYFGFMPFLRGNYFNDWYDLVNEIPKQLLLGKTTFQALQSYESLANDLYTRYLTNPNINIRLLFKNALYMNLAGDREAKI